MSFLPRVGRTLSLAATTLLLVSCDDSTGSDDSIVVALSSGGVSVTAGSSTTTNITITRTGGFAGVVSLSVAGLPPGVGVGFIPAQLSATEVTSTVNVTVAPTAAPGIFNATITASAAGLNPATVNLQLTIAPAPDFRLSITNSALGITAGQSGNTTVNIERTNYAGEIALALINAPAGVTASFSPNTVSANSTAMTISVGAAVTPATYPVQIEGVGAGVGARTVTLFLSVQPNLSSFTISLSPTVFSIPRGNSATVNITLARTEYSGPITLAFENAPAGITGSITPTTTTGNTATLTVNVGDNVAPSGYQLRVRGTAAGFVDRVSNAQVTVTVPVGASVEYLYCSADQVPLFFAYQDGSGAWKQVTPTTEGTITRFAFTLVQGRGGILTVEHTSSPFVADALANRRAGPAMNLRRSRTRMTRGGASARALPALLVDQYFTSVMYASAQQLARDGIGNCQQTLPTRTVSGTVVGVSLPEFAVVSLGGATATFLPGATPNPVILAGVADGMRDLVASRSLSAGNAPDRVLVMRGLDIPDGGEIPTPISFGGPNSSQAATANATITGAGADHLELFTDLVTSNGRGTLWFDFSPNQNTIRPWGGLAEANMIAGDFHGLAAFATPVSGNASDFRVFLRFLGVVADQTMAMGPVLSTPTASQVAAGAYPRYRFQGPVQADYNKGVSVDITSPSGGNGYSIIASAAWLAGAGMTSAYDLTMPDVSTLPGFPPVARLSTGPNDAAVSAFGWTGSGLFDLLPAIGAEFKAASRGLGIVVP